MGNPRVPNFERLDLRAPWPDFKKNKILILSTNRILSIPLLRSRFGALSPLLGRFEEKKRAESVFFGEQFI